MNATGPTSSEIADAVHPSTVDCSLHPHIDADDLDEHARWHAEQAAHLDTDQQVMFG